MISNISAAWKNDMIENFAHEKRVYINPRGIQYPPIASNNGFTYKQSTYNMGRYYAYQGTATYIHTLTQPMTIDLMLNTPATSTTVLEWSGGGTAYSLVATSTAVTSTLGAVASTSTITGGWHRITVVIGATQQKLYIDGTLKDTDNISAISNYSTKLVVNSGKGLAWLKIYGVEASATDVLNNFKTVYNAEAFWSFNGHACGEERCNITRHVYQIGTRRTNGKAGELALALHNTNGEFSDDQYGTFTPEAGIYNGTSSQKYLQRQIPVWVEDWYQSGDGLYPSDTLHPSDTLYPAGSDANVALVFVGVIPVGGIGRGTALGANGTVSCTAYDYSYNFVRRIMWRGQQYSGFTLSLASINSTTGIADPGTWGTSLLHEYVRLATRAEEYNYMGQTDFAGTLSNTWTPVASTIAAGTGLLQTNSLQLAAGTTSVYQIVTFDLTKGERFSFSCLAKFNGDVTITIGEYTGSTLNDSTAATFVCNAASFRYISVAHTITNSASDRLRVTIAKAAGATADIDAPMLNYGDPAYYYAANTNVGTSGVFDYNNKVAGTYDTCGIDVDAVAYTHPWAVIEPHSYVWNHIVALCEASAARAFGFDGSGCFVMRSQISSGDPTSKGAAGAPRGVGVNMPQKLNHVSINGAYITKATRVATIWTLSATGWEDEELIDIPAGTYYPTTGSVEATYNDEPILDWKPPSNQEVRSSIKTTKAKRDPWDYVFGIGGDVVGGDGVGVGSAIPASVGTQPGFMGASPGFRGASPGFMAGMLAGV